MSKQYMELREWCMLVDEECDSSNCEGCFNNTPRVTQHEENLQECVFEREIIINDILPAMVNRSNIIAKIQRGNSLVSFIKQFNLKQTGYSPTNLKQYPAFFMLKKTLGLGIPHKIYVAKNKSCIVIYEDDVYLIAPRVDNE